MAHSPLFKTLIHLLKSANSQSLQRRVTSSSTSRKKSWSRRRFLRYSTLAGGAAIATLTDLPNWRPALGSTHPTIAIIGGGIAGLNAAYQLKKLGLRATVYEAKSNVGGRIQSGSLIDRELVNDFGGSFVNTDHEDILALAEEFGLELFNRFEHADTSQVTETAFYYEGRLIPEAEMAEKLSPLAAQIGSDAALLEEDFDTYVELFDVLSVTDYLNQHQDKILAPFVRTLIESGIRTEYGVEPEEASVLQLLFNLPTVNQDAVEPLSSDETFCFKEGSGKLIESLSNALSGQIRTGLCLRRIQSRNEGFQLTLEPRESRQGNPLVVNADYIILAIPFPALRRVDLQTPLPDGLRQFIQEVDLGRNEKLFAGFRDRPWRQATGFTVDAWTDLGFAQLWEDTQRQPEQQNGVLTFFMGSREVRPDLPVLVLGQQFLSRLDRQLPGTATAQMGHFVRTGWANDLDIGGGYTNFKPGQYLKFSEFLYIESENPEERVDVHIGNLVFAGEHLSDEFYGYMNGAAQTGRLAAEVIANLVQQTASQHSTSTSITALNNL
ncbi:FAD-dependent oxidoreductase [Oscillatoria sp. FACHB-1407]|uniref:flavin monoamine oxidase family protein n=1 Tax=Oscillatoria sp. FACHB-1407 TaxID=2692847 RepID=UPI001689B610|nr:NAD(P)/FAD-dependent oxidoreductase [Oscillatoria sp. FACHB-1407]MBD2461976.1 FAD-dependent oxidoreductase [Oscillatoria sp. FACHB-1407]